MQYLEGQTLKQKIAGKLLDIETVLELCTQIADALDAAHSKGIHAHKRVYRDQSGVTSEDNVFFKNKGYAPEPWKSERLSPQISIQTAKDERARGEFCHVITLTIKFRKTRVWHCS